MTATATDRLNQQMDSDNGFNGNGHEETTLAVLNRSEIDMQIATAKRYPRSIARAKTKMIEMATNDLETAQGCVYALKRNSRDGGSNFIEGPSVRLAEIAINAWGNIRAGARVIGEDGGFIVAQGVCHDLEANSCTTIEVRRRITGRDGRRYSDDMIGVTANAACAIALRNAVFKIVPKVYILPAYGAAQKLIAGDERSIGQRRQSLVEYFSKLHVDVPKIMTFLDKPDGGIDDITGDDLVKLHGVATAIRDGDTSIDEEFPSVSGEKKSNGGGSSAADLNAKLDAAKKAKQQASKPHGAPQPEPDASSRSNSGAPASGEAPAGTDTNTGEFKDPDAQTDVDDKHQDHANVGAGGGDDDSQVQQWPATLPKGARGNDEWINDAIRHFKREDVSANTARANFHAKDAKQWNLLGTVRQQEKYAALMDGTIWAAPDAAPK